MKKRPIIGLLAEIDAEQTALLKIQYVKVVEKSGGLPLMLPYVEESDTIDRFISLCDGFLFTGGADVNPCRYGETPKETCGEIQYYRDALEFQVLQKAIDSQKPILAICRGMQLVNVALGGSLYQDLPTEAPSNVAHRAPKGDLETAHTVRVLKDSPLYNLTGVERLQVNSFHHQAIKRLADGLTAMAVADDGLIEGVHVQGERYFRAYQWHPERLYETDDNNRRIFQDFIMACQGK